MFSHEKSQKLAVRHLVAGETLRGCWWGQSNPKSLLTAGLLPVGIMGVAANIAADMKSKDFYVFITDRRIVLERIHLGVGIIAPRRSDEVHSWTLAEVSNLRTEKALLTKWLHFESPDGPISIQLKGARSDDFSRIL